MVERIINGNVSVGRMGEGWVGGVIIQEAVCVSALASVILMMMIMAVTKKKQYAQRERRERRVS